MTDPVPHLDNLPLFTQPALCAEADPEAFFPNQGDSVHAPKAICRRFLARDECLTYALEHDVRDGVWGGASPNERQRMHPTPCTPGRPPGGAPGGSRPIRHGTEGGAQAHRRRGEKACGACYQAELAARRRRRAAA